MAEFLLELLSEEIPARMQTRAADDLKRLVGDGLKAAGLTFAEARAFATPRRLALVVDGLPAARPDVSEERRGPRVGAPDQAIQGFLKGAGLASLDQAEKRDTGKGEFWFAVLKKKGGPTAEVLPGIIDTVMKTLPWPKSMKWSSGTRLWVRPLQSVIALFDGKVLSGEVGLAGTMAPIRFGDTTRGHRFLSKGEITVTGFADYVAKLRAAHVVLDPAERKRIILDGARKLTREAQVALKDDEGLLEEVAGLVEWPVPLLGTIDAQFMDVPPEVLIVSMKTHQRYFVTTRPDGTLANRFVVVANNVARDGGKMIVEGNERVLRSRLARRQVLLGPGPQGHARGAAADAEGHRLPRQARHAGRAGRAHRQARRPRSPNSCRAPTRRRSSMAADSARPTSCPAWSASSPSCRASWAATTRSARSCRRRWPMRSAITMRRPVRTTAARRAPVSIAVALADKLDALVSFWSIGEKPTGSRDPYALRRAALGVIRIVVENKLRLPLRQVLQAGRPARLLRRAPQGAGAREGRAARRGRCRLRAGQRGRSRAPAGAGRGAAILPRAPKPARTC